MNTDAHVTNMTIEAIQSDINNKDTSIMNAKKRIENSKRNNKQQRLVINATCIYATDVEESIL